MDLRILDLDGSVRGQTQLQRHFRPALHDLREWGPRLRLACGFKRFGQFESALAETLGSTSEEKPALSFLGSGDFHHVSLALLRRLRQPFNLLVLDKHPDWMRGIPFLHCGTWLHHAAHLPNVRTIFHVGGDIDFDNRFRWLAPWSALRTGKIQVISAVRRFQRGRWSQLGCRLLRPTTNRPVTPFRVDSLLEPFRPQLSRWPLYVSLDKDVMTCKDAVVNWDSGHLKWAEVQTVLTAFLDAAEQRLAGMDVVGDWSAVHVKGWGRRWLGWTEHPRLSVNAHQATHCNQRTNMQLLNGLHQLLDGEIEIGEHVVNGPSLAYLAS